MQQDTTIAFESQNKYRVPCSLNWTIYPIIEFKEDNTGTQTTAKHDDWIPINK